MIIIGVDPHKESHTATAIDAEGRDLASIRVAADRCTRRRLRQWASQWPQRRWAIEGVNGLGHQLAQQLITDGETVVDVPSILAARVRVLQTGHGRKTDQIDATAVATVALHRDLPSIQLESNSEMLRLLSDQREELAGERRRTINRLHRHLRDLIPGGAPTQLSARSASQLLTKVRPTNPVQAERKRIARQLVADIRRLDKALSQNRDRCRQAVHDSGSTITDVYGVGEVLAAKIIGHVGDISRFPSQDHFASYVGTAPIEASSGEKVRHRLSRAGNRQLNSAIHMVAHVQVIHPGPGRDYYRKKIAEGKTNAEARRALKRQVTKSIYRALQNRRTNQGISVAA